MMADRPLKSTPDGKLTVFKSGQFDGQNVWLTELKVLTLKFVCFWRCKRERRPAAVTIWFSPDSPKPDLPKTVSPKPDSPKR